MIRRKKFLKTIAPFLIILVLICCGWELFKKYEINRSPFPLEDCPGCNIIVIVIDTLRADHLPFYGYPDDTAPFLDSVAKKSVVFARGFSSSSWTAPATASIFTAMFPSRHGVITGFAATKDLQKNNPSLELNRLPEEYVLLSEYMRQAGYLTIGVTDNLNIGEEIGFDRGFDLFSNYKNEGAAKVNQKAKKFLDERKNIKPYFLYLHYMDPHQPYIPRNPTYSSCMKRLGDTKKTGTVCAYDSEIAYTDRHIKELFHRYHWLDNSIVIITSDHGEEFWDHGKLGHGKTLYTELIHVPFIIYHPKRAPQRVKYNVQTLDILPTIARMMDQPKDPVWEGRSLRRLMKGEPPKRPNRLIFSERLRHIAKDEPIKRSVIDGSWHYIETNDNNAQRLLLQQELFNLKSDFGEHKNLTHERQNIVSRLSERIADFNDHVDMSRYESITVPMDEKKVDELKSLGYF